MEDRGGVLHTRHIHSRRQVKKYYTPDTYTVEDGRSTTHQTHTQWKTGGVLHTRHIHSRRQGRSTTHQTHTQWKTGEEYYTPDTYTVEDGRSTTHQTHTQWKTGEEYYTPDTYTVVDRGGVMLLIKDNLNTTPFLLAIQRQKSKWLQYPHTLTYSGKLEYAIGQKIRHTCYKR